MDSTLICIACDKKIENNVVFFEGYPYHRKCIHCPFHHETNITGNIESDFVQVVPGIFLCSKHYGDYRVIQHLPSNIVKKYKKKYLQTIIPRLFCPPPILGDAIVLDKPYDVFLPTVQYHFDKNINDVDFMQLQEFLGDDVKIINAKNGSTIFKVILIAIKEFIIEGAKIIWRKFKKWAYNTIEKLTEKLLTKVGGLIIGNMVESPTISIPDENKIIDFLNRPEYKSLKIQLEAGEIDLNTMMLQVVEMVRNENFPQRAKYYINLGKEVDDAENQIIENNKMSKYEMKIINKISNTNANPQNYEKIVNRFAYGEIVQTHLYHGNNLNGNLNDDSNVYLQKSNKFLINSYYLADNVFYSSFSGKNKYKPLEIDEKADIVYCKVLYNKYLLENIKVLKKSPRQILENKGALVVDIGDSSKNFLPIDISKSDENKTIGKEFIVNDENQIIPLFVFTVLRNNHFILWKNWNIEKK